VPQKKKLIEERIYIGRGNKMSNFYSMVRSAEEPMSDEDIFTDVDRYESALPETSFDSEYMSDEDIFADVDSFDIPEPEEPSIWDPKHVISAAKKTAQMFDLIPDEPPSYEVSEGEIQPGLALKEGLKDVARNTLQAIKAHADITRKKIGELKDDPQILKLKQNPNIIPGFLALSEEDLTPEDKEVSAQILGSGILESDEALKRPEGFKGYVQDFIKTAPQIGSQVVATVIGGPLAGIGLMGAQITGSTYENLVREGVEPERAFYAGVANALFQAPLEQIGVGKVMKVWKPQKTIIKKLKNIAAAAGTEWLTEFAQAYPDLIVNVIAKNPDSTAVEKAEKIVDQLWEATKQGAYEGTLTAPWALIGLAAPGRVAPKTTDEIEAIEKETVKTVETLKQDYESGKITFQELKSIQEGLPERHPEIAEIDKMIAATPPPIPERIAPEQQKRIDSFDEMGKRSWEDFQTGKMTIAPETDETKSVQKVADSLKMGTVVFYDAPDTQLNDVNGFFNYKTKEIYINKNTEKPLLYVAGHESLHRLKEQSPDLYKKLITTLSGKAFKFEEYATGLNLKRGLVDLEDLTKAELSEEFIADFTARAIATPEFWNKLNAENPTTTRKLAEILIDLINQIRKTLGVKTREYFKDIDAIGELAKTYAEFAKKPPSEVAEAIKPEILPVAPKAKEIAKPTIVEAEKIPVTAIPKLKTTMDAIAFGKKATSAEVAELKRLRKETDKKSAELQKAGKLQESMDIAVVGQYYREAVEASEGKIDFLKPPEKKKIEPEKPSKVRTMRGAIKALGGMNFLNHKGELKDMPTSVKYLSKKDGAKIDDLVIQLVDDNWLDPGTTVANFLEMLRTDAKSLLGRDRLTVDISEKKEYQKSEAEKKFEKEMAWEPEAPPEGKYVQMKAEDLPIGKELTLIEGKSSSGWDLYEVISKSKVAVKLKDGIEIELDPGARVEVLKKDLAEKEAEKKAEVPFSIKEQLGLFDKPKPEKKDIFGEPKKKVKEKKIEPKAVFGQKMAPVGRKKKEVPTSVQLDLFEKTKKQIQTTMFAVKRKNLSPLAQEYLDMLIAAQPTLMPTEDTKADPSKGLRKEVAERMELSKGIGRPSIISKVKGVPKSVWHLFTRSFEELDPKEYGGVSNVLRLHKEVRTSSNRRAVTLIDQIVGGLKPKQYDMFRMEIIMGDMLKDIESGLLSDEKGLPFGFENAQEAQDYYNEVRKSAGADPVIKDALRRRTLVNNKLKSILVKNGLLPESVMDDDRYFHHQVMEYRAVEKLGNEWALSTGTGTKALLMRKKGWQKARKGSIKEYNTDYIQAEFEVLAQGIAQLETKNTLNRLKGLADMTGALKLQAKAQGIEDWRVLIPEGSIEWSPSPGSAWFRASSLTDRMLMQIQSGEITDPDIIKNVWAKGKDATWIIPQELAKTLNDFGKGDVADTVLDQASRTVMNSWKKWILINPYRIIKYNLNNMSGDADIAFAYDPKIMVYFNQARKDLWAERTGKTLSKELKGEMDLAYRQGVVGSGWSVQDIAGVAEELSFNKKIEALTDSKPGFVKRAWRWSADITSYRENILRLAAYRYFKNRIAKGEKNIYAASNKKEVDAIKDDIERAAKLSRDLIGDYGNISAGGQWLRRHLIPFWSWCEVNAPRYVRLIRNLKHEDQGVKKGARITGLVSAKIAWKGTKLAVKATALMAAVMVWNRAVFPDEEDELGEAHRRQMHLILGRRSDGTIITLRFQGALSDALSWFGGEDIASDIKDIVDKKVPISEKAKDAALAPVIKVIQGLRPDIKVPAELLAGESYYPDPFFPRPIRDKWEHIARLFSLNSIQGYLAGKPKRGGTLGGQLLSDIIALGFYTSDPGESAFWNTKKKTFDYLDKLDVQKPRITPTDKANAMYYYKRALKYGDLKAAEKYLRIYIDKGGTPKGMRLSIKTSEPLGSLTKKDKLKFIKTLTEKEKETLAIAEKWYRETYKSPKVTIPWPTEYYLKRKRGNL
jgi:hypothetical protein